MALTEIGIVNMALSRLGVSETLAASANTIATITSADGPSKTAVNLHYDRCLRRVLKDHWWNVAKRYASLTQVADAVATDAVWQDDWLYSYRYPTSCVEIRRVVTGSYQNDPKPPEFEIGADDTGPLVYCDVESDDATPVLVVEYSKAISTADIILAGDTSEKLVDALAWLLASEMAGVLSISDEKADRARNAYLLAIQSAERSDRNEGHPFEEPDGDFLQARNGWPQGPPFRWYGP